jgi:hypothetical protein
MHSNFNIVAPDQGMAAALQQKIDQKTKPLGSLGQLEKVAKKIGLIQQRLDPQFNQPQMLVFAGDHGAAKAGVSAYPQDVTWQMVENFLAGGAAINVFARQNEMYLSVIDAGVAHDFGRRPGLINAKVALGTANYIEEPAMTAEQCANALARGAEISPQPGLEWLQCRRLRRNGHWQHGFCFADYPLPDRRFAGRLRRPWHRAGRCRAGPQAGAAGSGADPLPQLPAAATSRRKCWPNSAASRSP